MTADDRLKCSLSACNPEVNGSEPDESRENNGIGRERNESGDGPAFAWMKKVSGTSRRVFPGGAGPTWGPRLRAATQDVDLGQVLGRRRSSEIKRGAR
eukprot:9364782-Pyramimonas_sp.AAC.1